MSATIDVKVFYVLPSGARVTHRWLLDESSVFDELLARLQAVAVATEPRLAHSSGPLSFTVAWNDGEDWCTLTNPRSLDEAIFTNRELGQRVLRLQASLAKEGEAPLARDAPTRPLSAASFLSEFPSAPVAEAELSVEAPRAPQSSPEVDPIGKASSPLLDDAASSTEVLLSAHSPRSDDEESEASGVGVTADPLIEVADEESDGELVQLDDGVESQPSTPSSAASTPKAAAPTLTSTGTSTDATSHAEFATQTSAAQTAEPIPTQTELAQHAEPIATQTDSAADEPLVNSSVLVVDESTEASQPSLPQVDESGAASAPVEIQDVTGHMDHIDAHAGDGGEEEEEESKETEAEPTSDDQAELELGLGLEREVQIQASSEQSSSQQPQPVSRPSSASSSSPSSPAPLVVHNGVRCDGCGEAPIRGVRWHCTVCSMPGGFDLCSRCEAAGKHPLSHVLLKMRVPAHVPIGAFARRGFGLGGRCPFFSGQQAQPQASPAPSEKPKATFLSDVTVSDDTTVCAGERLVKVWRVQNTGRLPWPLGTRLVFVGGDLEPAPGVSADGQSAVVPFAGPGDIVHLSIEIVVPDVPGRYRAVFRLAAPDGQRFGPRVWLSFNVPMASQQPQQPQQQAVQAAQPEPVVEPQAQPVAVVQPQPVAAAVPVAIVTAPAAVSAPVATPVPVSASAPPLEPLRQPVAVAAPVVEESKEAEEAQAGLASLSLHAAPQAVSLPSPSEVDLLLPRPQRQSPFQYGNELATLRSMGFTDAALCKYLLLNNSGDVAKVVNWLLTHAHPSA